ncbi:hypothetical protein [Microvirga tunisiensis]|uniref:Uncharacterized protein n=1 Tax=Microvirga tunisiensis TaxID=2108360 RepID=A0A5N7MLG7_9HYPH|nr:hypothetical protein [Microvirga tunisiensis]MPR09493.1 hypothetical protein [Microvirga tunisiensis]MPR27688.1 hypothetical protein [Microvirga tunisiensis]
MGVLVRERAAQLRRTIPGWGDGGNAPKDGDCAGVPSFLRRHGRPGLDPGISPGHPDPEKRRAEGSAPLSSPASVGEGRGSTPTLTADGFPVSSAARPSGHDTLPVMAGLVPAIPMR